MPRVCTICSHPNRAEIDEAIVSGGVIRAIARQWGVSKDAVARHRDNCLPSTLTKAYDAAEIVQADQLLDELQSLKADAARIGEQAERASEYHAALRAVREQGRIIETLLRVAGELVDGAMVNIRIDASWISLRAQILAALEPFPDARRALAEVLNEE